MQAETGQTAAQPAPAGTGKTDADGRAIRRLLLRGAGLLLALNLCYLALMTAAFALPLTARVRGNVRESLHTWRGGTETEGPVFNDNRILWNDTRAEMQMADIAATEEGSVLSRGVALYWKFLPQTAGENEPVRQYRALEAYLNDPEDETLTTETYERYWFLIAGALRILYSFLTIGEIRWLLLAGSALLFLWLACRVYARAGIRGVLPLAAAFLSRNLLLHSAYSATAMDVYTALAAMIAVTYLCDRPWFEKNRPLFYLALGSVTFAIGPFIAPLLTLGMTLLLEIALTGAKDRDKSAWVRLIGGSVLWVAGYAVTMLVKAALSMAIVRQADGFGVAAGYMGSESGAGLAARVAILSSCVTRLLMPVQPAVMMAGVFVLTLAALVIRRGMQKPQGILLTLAVALYPVLWALVVSEHMRHDYAVNIFAVTVYGIAAVCAGVVGEKA